MALRAAEHEEVMLVPKTKDALSSQVFIGDTMRLATLVCAHLKDKHVSFPFMGALGNALGDPLRNFS